MSACVEEVSEIAEGPALWQPPRGTSFQDPGCGRWAGTPLSGWLGGNVESSIEASAPGCTASP